MATVASKPEAAPVASVPKKLSGTAWIVVRRTKKYGTEIVPPIHLEQYTATKALMVAVANTPMESDAVHDIVLAEYREK